MNGPTVELPIGTRNWTALETLAEVSRQIGVGENGEAQPIDGAGTDNRTQEQQRTTPLELREQYTLDNPPVSYEQRVQRDKKGKLGMSKTCRSIANARSGRLEEHSTTK